MVSEAVWRSRGIEMAQPLFWQTKTVGVVNTPAKFIASWKSPSEVAPSPKKVIATASSPRSLDAQAMPTAWIMCPPTVIDGGSTLTPSGGCPPRSSPVRPRIRFTHG